jgi:hypothetical protein
MTYLYEIVESKIIDTLGLVLSSVLSWTKRRGQESAQSYSRSIEVKIGD